MRRALLSAILGCAWALFCLSACTGKESKKETPEDESDITPAADHDVPLVPEDNNPILFEEDASFIVDEAEIPDETFDIDIDIVISDETSVTESSPDLDIVEETADDDAVFLCPAAAIGERIHRNHLIIGGSMRDEDFSVAPFDMRYQYLAGDVPVNGPCLSCAHDCSVRGQSCANADGGCAWWGCWQWDEIPPGQFVRDFIEKVDSSGAIPLITYYVWFSVAGDVETAPEIAALQNGDRVRDYLADFRFLCSILGEYPAIPIFLHLEPDLWGYGHQVNKDPTLIPVALSSAGIPACSGLGNHFAGFAQCLLTIVRTEAPQVLLGFHASAWGAGHDALMTTDPSVDLNAHAEETATYLRSLGADAGDFIVVEMSDRDAGFNGRWWDPTNMTRPHFHQAIGWVQHMSETLGLPSLWWQVPYGHLGLPNICDQYEDNRVDYVFDHPEEFAAAGSLGVLFGAGAECMTTPATDGGHFLDRASQWYASERPLLCGP